VRVTVVGAGVIGLSSGIRLLEAGHEVRIVARERTPLTTSDVAAAVWFPFLAHPLDRVLPWARATYDALAALAKDPAFGVHFADVVDLLGEPGPAEWGAALPEPARPARADELPSGYAHGWVARVPFVRMPTYLAALEAWFQRLGGRFVQGHVRALEDLAPQCDVAVNCVGLGARELCQDWRMRPIRGQIARLRNPGVERALLDDRTARAVAYVIPFRDVVIAGGTAEEGVWSLGCDPLQEQDILAKAAALEPRLVGPEVVARAVGLRPGRDAVRLEEERLGGLRVVHNYGHGGSGVTLSWGCADEVARCVR
jgi:D-amino-acid oxidase